MSAAIVQAETTLPIPAKCYDARELGELLGIRPATVFLWERQGRIPRGRRFGPKIVRWMPEDVASILSGREG